ncbi:MAG: HAD-IIIA family hydrolase, partial [Ignavibacteria bacterium]
LEKLYEVHNELNRILKENDVLFEEYFYCYHHPEGVVPGYTMDCECRKPKTFFVSKAVSDHGIDVKKSWLIGDRDKDIECGIKSGLKTVLIKSEININTIKPDIEVAGLRQATEKILSTKKTNV